ncbi:hypothetical protein QJQ45_024195 [Haematococcus lacustris]|nr:hypothetical protein QJQ45_024195 [Haematococcus lacustris]
MALYRPAVKADTGESIDWAAPIRATWDMSEAAALRELDRFLAEGLSQYEKNRHFADARAVSRLSPYLRWGQLSPRLLWHRMRESRAASVSKTFHRRLVWRELAYWQLHHWPLLSVQPVREAYADVKWESGPQADELLAAWQQGRTGFPLVDAGMRELWHTGWMQQSLRMVCAAFLTELAGLTWTAGAAWFHHTLVDADPAINSMMWQNAGKSGLDQWNFSMDPVGKAQDPQGNHIRKWVPELAELPDAHVHTPWLAPPDVLEQAGVHLGRTYPHRVLQGSLQAAKAQGLAKLQAARDLHAETWCDARGYDLVIAPKGSSVGLDGKKVVVFTIPELRAATATKSITDVASNLKPEQQLAMTSQ